MGSLSKEDKFDPYYKWLGIPVEEQPPTFYRLLGLTLFEADEDVISSASDRQMAHLKSFQTGHFSFYSQQLLNEISSARLCLLNPTRKEHYDRGLRQQAAAVTAYQRATERPQPPPEQFTNRAPEPSDSLPHFEINRNVAPRLPSVATRYGRSDAKW